MQIQLPEADRPFFRFLWRNGTDSTPSIFEFQRVIFGGTASPFQAQFVARENAILHSEEFPRASETVLHSTYMDDSMDSEKSIGKTETLCRELNGLWRKAGMVPRKWLSNDPRALASIPHENGAKHISIDGVDRLPVSKTLGLKWDAQNDMLIFKISMPSNIPDTKRTFLKVSAAIFDPMGFISPFTVIAKIDAKLVAKEM